MKSLATALLFIVGASLFAEAAAETLIVKVTGLQGTTGKLEVTVWKGAAGFPTDPAKAIAARSLAVTGPRMEVRFSGLSRGVYAVAAYQDLNGNGKLDRSLLGWPTEPVGASNNATGVMGPPKYKDAALELKQATQIIEFGLQ